jgi:RHS repeat-associated protein
MTDSSTNFYTWANGETLTASLDGETVFYCHDANKNVTDLVDDSGDSVAHYEYSPFGVITTDPIGSLSTDNPFRFSNEYFDYTTGFVEYKYRKYNPYLGKFLSRDPIDVQGGLNLYAICANDCVNSKDYTGLFSIKKGPVTLGTCGDWGTYADFNDLPGAGWLIQHVKKTYKYTRKCNAAYNYDSRTKKLTAKCECCKDCENAKEVVIDDFYEAFPFFSKSEFQTWDIRDTTSGMEENAECTNGSMMNKKTIVWFGLLPLDGKCPKGFRKRSGKDDPSGASMCTRFDAPDGWDVKKSEASKTYGYTATWNCADNPSEKTKVEEF